MELGGEGWRKLIEKYRIYGKKQKVNIPSFQMLNTLMDPEAVRKANQDASHRKSINDII